MAKPKHREVTAEALAVAPEQPQAVYHQPGGQVGRLHDRIEQQLAVMKISEAVTRPASSNPMEQLIHSISRLSGIVALVATSAALVLGIVAVLS